MTHFFLYVMNYSFSSETRAAVRLGSCMGVPSACCCISPTQALDLSLCSVSILKKPLQRFCLLCCDKPWAFVVGLKISVKLEQKDWQERSSHSSFAPLFHLYLLEGALLSFWSSSGMLSVCMKKTCLQPLSAHLWYGEMCPFPSEVWAMVTWNGEHDANFFSPKWKSCQWLQEQIPTALCNSLVLLQGVWFPQCAWAVLLFH